MSDRQILINLVASLCLSDHMGDAMEAALEALKQAGLEVPVSDLADRGDDFDGELMRWLGRNHSATTLYGTSVLDE